MGIGGAGGYLGGKLAKRYFNSADVEIIFICRGDHAKVIKQDGLKLITPEGERMVHPHLISTDPEEIGTIDLLICCTKSYNLEESISSLRDCIGHDTYILPILNGVDSTSRIKAIVPDSKVLNGCMYIVSERIRPGVIKKSSAIARVLFGMDSETDPDLIKIESMLKDAGIDITLTADILNSLWSKFTFISPVATMTSFLNMPIGEILENETHKNTLTELMKEVILVSRSQNIELPDDIIDRSLAVASGLPYQTTSSMQKDFVNNRETELETITGYIAAEGEKSGLPIPNYKRIYSELKNMTQ